MLSEIEIAVQSLKYNLIGSHCRDRRKNRQVSPERSIAPDINKLLFTCVKQTHSLRSFVCLIQLVSKNHTRPPTVKNLQIVVQYK